jgi:hypothetical protein
MHSQTHSSNVQRQPVLTSQPCGLLTLLRPWVSPEAAALHAAASYPTLPGPGTSWQADSIRLAAGPAGTDNGAECKQAGSCSLWHHAALE